MGAGVTDLKSKRRIKVTKDGPYIVSGNIPLAEEYVVPGADGEPARWEKGPSLPHAETYSLCRCGATKHPPFCDRSHTAARFAGAETAGREDYLEQAEKTVGPGVDLTWSAEVCAEACFCHRGKGAWDYAEQSDDPAARSAAVEESCACPSGSLVAWDKASGQAIEPALEPSISVIEDPGSGTSGPLWVKGGIQIEAADGFEYERRNRVTLCRCGLSKVKPFCDGAHVPAGFKSKP
jgi:CDGSH-type Zn-finger protein